MTEPARLTLLHGNDELAISAALEKLCDGLGDASTAAMNISRFDGRAGVDFESLNLAVNATPFLAPRRVILLIHPVSAFSTAEGRKKFLTLLEKAPPTSTIGLAEYEELKRDHWLLKWAAAAGAGATTHIYNLPKRWEMPRWVEGEAKKQGGKIEPDAAARLAEMVGEDTRIAALELTKLLTYVNYERAINLADVEKVSLASAQGNVFELVDALGQGDGRKAQHTLHQLLENEEAFELWGMVIRQFRLLILARELLDANGSAAEVQRTLGVHEFVAQKVTAQARRFSMPALESIYHKLLEIDEGAKTSQVPLDLALDTLVVSLAHKA
jgi:DNA polymerase III subunit delta